MSSVPLLDPTLHGYPSGRVGSTVFTHGPFGPYNYEWVARTDPATSTQLLLRQQMSDAYDYWVNLTQAQRNGWIDYAANVPNKNRIGRTYYPTGFNRFCGAYVFRFSTIWMNNGDPPTTFTKGQHSIPEMTLIKLPFPRHTFRLTLWYNNPDPWKSNDWAQLRFYRSQAWPSTVHYHRDPFRILGTTEGNSWSPPINDFANMTGVITVGQAMFIRVRIIEGDCRLSPATVSRVIAQPEPP